MKNILIISILTLSFAKAKQVNAQWHQVNTNTTENLYDIFFVDSLEGYCVGGSDDWGTTQSTGVILKTTDGGENWTTVFSTDSLTIKYIAIVEVSGNNKLYAYALKNGASYLISAFINTPFQNWSINSISYKPKGVKVHNNEIFFVDEMDNLLKKLTTGTFQNVTSQTVSIFDINTYGLLFVNENADRIFYSTDIGASIDTLSSHPVEFGENQLTGARAFLSDNYYLIYGTYPEGILASFDNGNNWSYNYTNYFLPCVLNENEIIAYNDNNIIKSDYHQTYIDTLEFVTISPNKIYCNNNMGFVISNSGEILKSNNVLSVGVNNSELKKKINIYPNPAKDVLQIDVLNGIEIENVELFDISGKKAKTYNKTDRNLNITGLSSGIYFLRISTSEGGLTKKMVIE